MVAAGCGGGDSGGGSTSTGRLLRYGAVASPVADKVAGRMGDGSFSPGQEVHQGDVVTLDGDAMSPTQVQNDKEIERVFASGASVMIVDAKTAHKEAMRGAKRAAGSVDDDSYAVLYTPFMLPSGDRGIHTLDLAAGQRTSTKKSVVQRKTGTVQGAVSKTTIVRPVAEVSLERFAARTVELGDTSWSDPLASTVPAQVSWISAPYELIEQGDDAALSNEAISEDITFIFRGFYSPPLGDGALSNLILVEHDGTTTVGAPTVETVTNDPNTGYIQVLIGWFQTSSMVSITPDRTNPSGQLVQGGVPGIDLNGGDTYQGTFSGVVEYYDENNNLQAWSPNWNIPATPLTVTNWTASPDWFSNDPVFYYDQTYPFDARSPDYAAALDPNQIGQFLPLPSASTSSLTLSGTSSFATSGRIAGPVRFNMDVSRTYTELFTEFITNPDITFGTGGTTLEEDGNREFVLDMNLCQPGGGTQQ